MPPKRKPAAATKAATAAKKVKEDASAAGDDAQNGDNVEQPEEMDQPEAVEPVKRTRQAREKKEPPKEKGDDAPAAKPKSKKKVAAKVAEPKKAATRGKKKPEAAAEPAPKPEKKAKKQVDAEDPEEDSEKPVPEKKGKGRKKAPAKTNKSEDEADNVSKAEGGRKPARKVAKNATVTQWTEIDFGYNSANVKKEPNVKITSWNVDGMRAWLRKDGLAIVEYEKPDILCIQETKCTESKLPDEMKHLDGYHTYWCSSQKEGYAGVGLLSKNLPIEVQYGIASDKHDNEGRCIIAEFEKFYVINVYVPNAGRGLVTLPKRLDWNEKFQNLMKDLDEKKPIIVCGDMNVAHNEIDLANPKTNTKSAGFTKEERQGMTEFLEHGFVDSYRHLYPDEAGAYTFWTYMSNARTRNVGWRLDYFLVSKRFTDNVQDNVIRKDVLGSDHCPITLYLTV